jgi:hypothetical protein
MTNETLFSAYGAAELLQKDRQTIVRALRDVPPDARAGNSSRWRLLTILKASEGSKAKAARRGEADRSPC